MNKFEKLSFGLAIVLALSFVAFATEEPENADSRPVVEVQVDGLTFKAPVNENIQVSEARRQFDKETINSLFAKLSEMVDLIVVKRANRAKIGWVAFKIIPQALSNSNKLKQLQKTDTTPPIADGYANKMGDLIVDIAKIRTDEKVDAKEAKQRADNILLAIQKMTEQSSTGLYLDWTQFTVDGQPLTHYVAPILRWFRDNGYGMELKLFDKLAGVVKSLSSGKKKN